MALAVVNIAEDCYGPCEYEDADYYGNFVTRKVEVSNNFTRESKKKRIRIRKRKRKRGNCDSEENSEDPLVVFGRDIMLMILNHLDARSVALSLLVSRSWHGVASSDAIWSKKCEELWAGKAHLPRVSQTEGLSKLAAYSLSLMDGIRSAPEFWRNLDPYWKGTGTPMRRYFHSDGSQTADPGDKVWGGHECCYSIVTSFLADGKIRKHYVRINRWPQMLISRGGDWGWKMSNELFCYSSVPDVEKKGGTGPCFLAY